MAFLEPLGLTKVVCLFLCTKVKYAGGLNLQVVVVKM